MGSGVLNDQKLTQDVRKYINGNCYWKSEFSQLTSHLIRAINCINVPNSALWYQGVIGEGGCTLIPIVYNTMEQS